RPDVRNRVYLILDASGSMRDQVKGRTKFDVARQALGDMVKALPKGTEVALRVYGHRLLAIEKGAAEDTELVSGWTTLDVSAFQKTLQELSPKGKTPLTLSLKQAAGDVTSRRNDGQTLVVLLTDGGESTRGADPVEAAKAFAEKERVRFFVLGFDINREDWTRQLQDMAAAADGVYRPVGDATLLTRELISVVNPPAPAFSFTGDDGELMESGTFEDGEFSLKPGKYTLTLDPGADELTQTVWIRPGGTTRIQYTINPARRPLPVETSGEEQPESDASRPSFCTQCGNKLKPDAKFCTSCGESVR
ncbi:MAG: VWA domain-containing protein, partial [Kiritimatiellia bacterium]